MDEINHLTGRAEAAVDALEAALTAREIVTETLLRWLDRYSATADPELVAEADAALGQSHTAQTKVLLKIGASL
jgi:hypothetical protein